MGEREINSRKERRYCRVWDFSAYLLSNKNKDKESTLSYSKSKVKFFHYKSLDFALYE